RPSNTRTIRRTVRMASSLAAKTTGNATAPACAGPITLSPACTIPARSGSRKPPRPANREGRVVPLPPDPPVAILETHDVVLTEIVAALGLDQMDVRAGRILEPVHGAGRDVGRLVRLEQELRVADAHLRGAVHDRPVLAATLVRLQRQHVAGADRQALDLAVLGVLQHGETAPRTMYGRMMDRARMTARAQSFDDLAHFLRTLAIGDQQRV